MDLVQEVVPLFDLVELVSGQGAIQICMAGCIALLPEVVLMNVSLCACSRVWVVNHAHVMGRKLNRLVGLALAWLPLWRVRRWRRRRVGLAVAWLLGVGLCPARSDLIRCHQ